MAGTFPTLSWGNSALYPADLELMRGVKISKFLDGSEQRSITTNFLRDWKLDLSLIKKVDIDDLETFWDANKGDADSSWTFGLDGSTNMVFTDPSFPVPEVSEGLYSLSLSMRQTVTSGTYATGSLGTFPDLSTGAKVQLPFERQVRSFTTKNQLRGGGQISWSHFATQPMVWPMKFPMIGDFDADTWFTTYAKMCGAYHTTAFIDPVKGTFLKVRFAPAPIKRTYLGLGRNSLSFTLEQVLV